MHEDAVTIPKRIKDINGGVVSTVELDPWGANTSRSANSAFMPHSFVTYERDANGGQDAMARRYSVGGRFSQPDPYGGSYNFSDPQSLNRYAYTRNDPVNNADPTGLMCIQYHYTNTGTGDGFWTPWFCTPGIETHELHHGAGGGGKSGTTAGTAGKVPQNPDVNKPYTREFDCNRSANDLFRTIRRDFSKFGGFAETVQDGAAIASIAFEPGPITQGRTIGITTRIVSTSALEGMVPEYSRTFSVTVEAASTTSFRFRTNPGHVFDGTISFSARDVGSGRVSVSVKAQGNLGDRTARALYYAGGGSFEDDTWKNFLDNAQRSCGSLK